MFYPYLLQIASNVLLGIILWRALSAGMLRKYLVFYLFIGFVAATSIVQLVLQALWGTDSQQYYYAFYASTLPMPALQIWVLWDIYRRVVGNPKISWNSLFWPGILVISMTLLAVFKVAAIPDADIFHRYHAVTLPVQVILLLVVFRSLNSFAGVGLSRNVTGILMGLSLLVGLQTINFTIFLFLGAPTQAFSFLVQFAYFMVLGVFSYSLWEYRPARQLQPSSQVRVTELNDKLQRLVKMFLTPK
jgi:branched-subunit amino acid transport protein AzlD